MWVFVLYWVFCLFFYFVVSLLTWPVSDSSSFCLSFCTKVQLVLDRNDVSGKAFPGRAF